MTDAQDDLQPQPAEDRPARTDKTVAELREYLRNWIANATGPGALRERLINTLKCRHKRDKEERDRDKGKPPPRAVDHHTVLIRRDTKARVVPASLPF